MLCGLGLIAGALFLLSMPCHAKDEPIKLSTITNASEPSSVEVLRLFRQRIESHENLFKLVENSDPSLGLLFTEDCMPRQASEPYARSGCVKALFWASCRPRIDSLERKDSGRTQKVYLIRISQQWHALTVLSSDVLIVEFPKGSIVTCFELTVHRVPIIANLGGLLGVRYRDFP
jgi:hypothetical protein